ncbi:MAG: PAS domain S-box protein [Chloroflexota bacterium]
MEPIRLTHDQRVILDNLPDPVVIYDSEGRISYINAAFVRVFGWERDEVIGQRQHFVPQGYHSGLTGAGLILEREDSFLTPDTKRMTRDGRAIDVQINTSLFFDANGQRAGSIVIMRDITTRKRVEQREYEQRIFAQALTEIAIALTRTLQLEEVLDLILFNVGRVVPHTLALVDMVEGAEARVVGCRDWAMGGRDRLMEGRRIRIESLSYLRTMQQTGAPLVIDDLSGHVDESDLARVTGLRAYLGAPIVAGGDLLGFISLQSDLTGFFSQTHAERLQTFANLAAIAIQNARQYTQAQELAALQERQRLARDLHDAVSQTLFSASVMAETLALQADQTTPGDLRDGLWRLRELTQGAQAEMRTLLLELRPDALIKTDIAELLSYLVKTLGGRKKIQISLETDVPGRLPEAVQVALYRITQEALNNIGRHARAEYASVLLHRRSSGGVQLTISDDGQGFDPDDLPGGHFGLHNIRERAEGTGAQYTIESAPGEGTIITVRWHDILEGKS